MVRLIVLVIVAGGVLTSCAGGQNLGDYVPVWAGGIPSNAPPRPGTPEYNAYKQRLEGEAARDKSEDSRGPKTDVDAALVMTGQNSPRR